MGAGTVKKGEIKVQYNEEEEESIEECENVKNVLFVDNEELAAHEDLMVQACFCEVPLPAGEIFKYENEVLSKLKK